MPPEVTPSAAPPSSPPSSAAPSANPPVAAPPVQPVAPPPAAPSPSGDQPPAIVPATYEYTLPTDLKLPEGMEAKFDPADPVRGPVLKEATELARSLGLNQEQFSALIALDEKRQMAERQAIAAEMEAEREKLGQTAEARIKAVESWLTTLKLSEEERSEAALIGTSAAGVSLLEKLITRASGYVPGANTGSAPKPQEPPKSVGERIWPGGFTLEGNARQGAPR
jgi:hypothetical protein